jgi:hypothetical protein
MRWPRSLFKRLALVGAAAATVAILAAGCTGSGNGNVPYYGATDSRQPYTAGPPSPTSVPPVAVGR